MDWLYSHVLLDNQMLYTAYVRIVLDARMYITRHMLHEYITSFYDGCALISFMDTDS